MEWGLADARNIALLLVCVCGWLVGWLVGWFGCCYGGSLGSMMVGCNWLVPVLGVGGSLLVD